MSFLSNPGKAARMLRHNLAFSTVVVATLSLSVAALILVGGAYGGSMQRELPFREADRLVEVMETTSIECVGCVDAMSMDLFDSWSARTQLASAAAGYVEDGTAVRVHGDSRVEPVVSVTAQFFPLLGIRPSQGRMPLSVPDDEGMVVVSSSFASERLGTDAIGSFVEVNGQPRTVVAVLPFGVAYPQGARVWVVDSRPSTTRAGGLIGVARLKAGATRQALQAEALAFSKQLQDGSLKLGNRRGVVVTALADRLRAGARKSLGLLGAAAACSVLLLLTNLTVLFLGRGLQRFSELSLRTALGATKGQIVRPVMEESFFLCTLGFVGGLGIAALLAPATAVFVAEQTRLPPQDLLTPATVLAGMILMSIAALAFGFVTLSPTLRYSGEVGTRIRAAATGAVSGASRGTAKWQESLVVLQVSSAMLLLGASALLLNSFLYTQRIELGFDADQLLVADLRVSSDMPGATIPLVERLRERAVSVPGATGFAAWAERRTRIGLRPGEPPVSVEHSLRKHATSDYPIQSTDVSSNFFKVVGIRILKGRAFDARDVASGEAVAIVDELAASRLWPGQDPIGARMKLGGIDSSEPWMRVVGVAASSTPPSKSGLFIALTSRERWPLMYRPLAQVNAATLTAAIRVAESNPRSAAAMKEAILSVAPQSFDGTVTAYREVMSRSSGYSRARTNGLIVAALAMIAVLISILGAYGVMANAVRARTQELGVRLALGASPASVVSLLLLRGAAIGSAGAFIGAATLALSTYVFKASALGLARNELFGTTWSQAGLMLGCGLVIVGVVVGAAIIPARRAASVDPALTLRID